MKNTLKRLGLILLAGVLASCSSSGTGGGKGVTPPDFKPAYSVKPTGTPDWRSMADIKKVFGSKATVTGNTVDLKGGEIDGQKLKRYDDSQDERNTPIKVRVPGLTIKNGYFTDIPGGVTAYERDITFQNIVVTDIGEDGISNAKDVAEGTQIINCTFYNDEKGDKSLQLNDGRGVVVRGTKIYGGATGMRLQESSGKKQNGVALIENTLFKNLRTGINAAGKTTVKLRNVKFEGVSEELHTSYDTVKFIKE